VFYPSTLVSCTSYQKYKNPISRYMSISEKVTVNVWLELEMIYLPAVVLIISATSRAVILLSVVNRVGWGMGGGSAAMGISTGQITSALSTQKRTWSPITSQRCQLIQSDCPSSDAGHSHRQFITEKMRRSTSVGRASAACWCVAVLRVDPRLTVTLHVWPPVKVESRVPSDFQM